MSATRRPHKYGARIAFYKGQRYDSQAEATYAQELDLRVAAGEIAGWERAARLTVVPGPRDRSLHYRPDFRVWDASGATWFVEVKGFETAHWKLLVRVLRRERPDVRLLIVTKDGERWLE